MQTESIQNWQQRESEAHKRISTAQVEVKQKSSERGEQRAEHEEAGSCCSVHCELRVTHCNRGRAPHESRVQNLLEAEG